MANSFSMRPGDLIPLPPDRLDMISTSQMIEAHYQEIRQREFERYSQELLSMGVPGRVNTSHFGQVRAIRKRLKEYSKEEFRKLSHEPLVKEILSGLSTIPKEEIADRIKAHLDK